MTSKKAEDKTDLFLLILKYWKKFDGFWMLFIVFFTLPCILKIKIVGITCCPRTPPSAGGAPAATLPLSEWWAGPLGLVWNWRLAGWAVRHGVPPPPYVTWRSPSWRRERGCPGSRLRRTAAVAAFERWRRRRQRRAGGKDGVSVARAAGADQEPGWGLAEATCALEQPARVPLRQAGPTDGRTDGRRPESRPPGRAVGEMPGPPALLLLLLLLAAGSAGAAPLPQTGAGERASCGNLGCGATATGVAGEEAAGPVRRRRGGIGGPAGAGGPGKRAIREVSAAGAWGGGAGSLSRAEAGARRGGWGPGGRRAGWHQSTPPGVACGTSSEPVAWRSSAYIPFWQFCFPFRWHLPPVCFSHLIIRPVSYP